jgi:hypothetical protein
MAQKIATFDDWKDLFYAWQKDVGFDASLIKDYKFDAIYDSQRERVRRRGRPAGRPYAQRRKERQGMRRKFEYRILSGIAAE